MGTGFGRGSTCRRTSKSLGAEASYPSIGGGLVGVSWLGGGLDSGSPSKCLASGVWRLAAGVWRLASLAGKAFGTLVPRLNIWRLASHKPRRVLVPALRAKALYRHPDEPANRVGRSSAEGGDCQVLQAGDDGVAPGDEGLDHAYCKQRHRGQAGGDEEADMRSDVE
jgi:hypothetical protein